VETHGRAETAKLIEGLEVVPRRRQEYRGVILEEMDLDAVLAGNPMSPSSTNWPTPMPPEAGTPNGTRMSRTSWPRGSTSSPR